MQVQFKCKPARPSMPVPLPALATIEETEELLAGTVPAAEPPGGCGWYDSSHELRHGLEIREDHDTLVFELWLCAAPSAAGLH